MDGRGIAKTTIGTLAICGLALAVARTAGAQVVYTDPDGHSYTEDERGNLTYCDGYGPDGKWVPCPGKSAEPGLWEKVKGLPGKAQDQWEKGKAKLNELNPLDKVNVLSDELAGREIPEAEEELPWRQSARSSASTRSYERSAKERPKQPCEKVGFAVAGENCVAWCFEVDDPYPGKNCYVRDAWFAEKRKAEELEKKARAAESPVRRTKTVSLPLHPAQPAGEQPWCHEIVNPLPPVNCIEYIPPAASASGGGTTINVHAPAAAEADPFDSVYDNYKSPTASRFGRVIGRAIKQKAERDRRKAEHKRLLSTLDRREGRAVEHKRQRAIAKSSTPPATRSRPTQPTGSTPRWRQPPVQVIKKPKSYAVKPTDYSRRVSGGSAKKARFCYPVFGTIIGRDKWGCPRTK